LVAQATASWSLPLAERTGAALAATYYDVWQARDVNARDFRSTMPMLRLDQRLGVTRPVSAGAGYRWVASKPAPDFDFAPPSAFVTSHHAWPGGAPGEGADWELPSGASLELRNFSSHACTNLGCADAQEPLRKDQFWVVHVEATRTGAFLA